MNGEGENNSSSSPFFFSNYVYQWLNTALDYGISEFEFWNMTLAELTRAVESKKRMYKIQQQEKAVFDYTLADLIGRSIARIYSSTNEIPPIADIYPALFDKEEVEEKLQEKRNERFALQLKQFAQAHNNKLKEAGKTNE